MRSNNRRILKNICEKNNYLFDIISVNTVTDGPATSVYKAFIENKINLEDPLIISNSDQILDWNFDNFINKSKLYDGCVLTYKPNYNLILGKKCRAVT